MRGSAGALPATERTQIFGLTLDKSLTGLDGRRTRPRLV
jgi:hypothetical protein